MQEKTLQRHDQLVRARGKDIRAALSKNTNAKAVAQELGVPPDVVRHVKRQLPASEMRAKTVGSPRFDEEVIRQTLARVRKDADPPNGVVTERLYVEHRRPNDPSLARLQQRFGRWNDMLAAFNLPSGPSSGHRVQYERDDCVSALAACAAELGHTPTYPQYETWARNHTEAPSGQTVRNRLGRWLEALAAAGL
jgi:hypothetical protein